MDAWCIWWQLGTLAGSKDLPFIKFYYIVIQRSVFAAFVSPMNVTLCLEMIKYESTRKWWKYGYAICTNQLLFFKYNITNESRQHLSLYDSMVEFDEKTSRSDAVCGFCGSPWTEELLHRRKLVNSPRVDDDAMSVSLCQPSGSLRGGECLIWLISLLKCPPRPRHKDILERIVDRVGHEDWLKCPSRLTLSP